MRKKVRTLLIALLFVLSVFLIAAHFYLQNVYKEGSTSNSSLIIGIFIFMTASFNLVGFLKQRKM